MSLEDDIGLGEEGLGLGDIYDNVAAFNRILGKLDQGEDIQVLKPELQEVRRHIFQTKEVKSIEWLLVEIQALLEETREG